MPAPDPKDIDALLQPVKLESFTVTPQTQSKNNFAGIPQIDKSKMWDFSLTEDGDGGRILSFLVDNKTVNFKLQKSESGAPIGAIRLPDSESEDFGIGGQSRKGRAQIHKAGPSRILGTFQTGKNNMTFEMGKSPDKEHDWSLVPRKSPDADVAEFVKAVLEKRGADTLESAPFVQMPVPTWGSIFGKLKDKALNAKFPMPSMDTLTYPLTGPAMGGMAVSGGLGAGAMAIKNMIDRIRGAEHNSLFADMALGAGGGAATAGLWRLFNGVDPKDAGAYTQNMRPGKYPQFTERFTEGKSYWDTLRGLPKNTKVEDGLAIGQLKHQNPEAFSAKATVGAPTQKKAFMSGNQEVDMIALQSILGADPTITPAERRALAGQARMAMSATGSTSVSVNEVKASGLGMLAGYIMSKAMGFGGLGTLASVAIGGAIGRGIGGKSGPTWNSRGYYEY